MKKMVIFPQKSDYPNEMFRYDIPIEYHAGCARAYFRKNFIAQRFFIKRIEEAVNILPNDKFKRTLDIGSGSGIFLSTLSSLYESVYTINLSPVLSFVKSMLGKRRINNLYLCSGTLQTFPTLQIPLT